MTEACNKKMKRQKAISLQKKEKNTNNRKAKRYFNPITQKNCSIRGMQISIRSLLQTLRKLCPKMQQSRIAKL